MVVTISWYHRQVRFVIIFLSDQHSPDGARHLVSKCYRDKLISGQAQVVEELGIDPDFIVMVQTELAKLR